MREGARGGSDPRPLGVMRRVVRWKARSYLQIWAIAAVCYLVCPVLVTLVFGLPRAGGVVFVTSALGWCTIGAAQSYRLNRRRTG